MKKYLLFAVFCLMFAPGAWARNLSLDETVDLVVRESWDIKKAEANVEKMRATLRSIHSNRVFKVDATAAYTNILDMNDRRVTGGTLIPATAGPDNIGTVGLQATQVIWTFGKIGFALDMARAGLRIAETSKRLAELEIRAAAVRIYWSAKMTDEMVRVADRALKNTKSAQSKLTATGRANRSNLVKISADVAARRIDLEDAKFGRDSAFRILKAYAGLDEGEPVALTTEFPASFKNITAKGAAPLEWDMLDAQAKIYDAEKWQNYMGYAPTLAAFGNYDYTTTADSHNDLLREYKHGANVGIALTMPLFDGGSKMALATASAQSAIAARMDLDKSKKLKAAEYDDLLQKHGHYRKQLKDLTHAKDLAQRAYDLSAARFLAGQTSATELSDVERALSQMEMAVLNAKFQILTTAEDIRKFEAGAK